MYKKLLDENIKNSGGINNFILSLRKEIRLLKVLIGVLFIFTLYKFLNISDFPETITTKQIPSIKRDFIAEIRIEDIIIPDLNREKMLDEIYKSNNIKGLLIVINSPGGDPASSELVYSKLKKISTKMPVIAFVEGLGASGAYMIAIGADKIVALRNGLIGSIGVVGSRFNFTDLMKNLGISYDQYVSSDYKEAGVPFFKSTGAQRQYLQDITMQYFNTFKNMVQEARGFSPIEIEKVANAKVFLAEESLKLKLIDAIGTKDLAIELISKRLEENNIKDLEVREVRPEPKRQQGFFDGIFTSAFKILTKIQANADIWNIQTILKY